MRSVVDTPTAAASDPSPFGFALSVSVRVVEGVGSGARDVRLHTGALPVRAGDGGDGAADWDGGFQAWVHGPALVRMCAAAGALADDYGAAELL